jgi:hypothetical protein
MKPALRRWVLIVALCSGVAAVATPYPTAEQLRKAVAEISPHLKSEQMALEILDARQEGIKLPLMAAGLRLGDGTCVVYVNDTPEQRLVTFFESVSAQDLPVWLNSIAVHEITHCIEQREAYIRRRFDLVLPPGLPRENVTVQGYLSVVQSGGVETWGEALADIVSVLYFRQVVPERWQHFANTLAALRSDLAGKWPEHDTSPWLRKIIASGANKPPEQSLFETAFALRRQYRPESIQ